MPRRGGLAQPFQRLAMLAAAVQVDGEAGLRGRVACIRAPPDFRFGDQSRDLRA
ncbi:MAG TPA: hypothetical protein VFR29_03135 [Steroidobacteraceae bacterium]|nr:hypothetical protein [Steroidobacteraceae bacterium]